MRPRTKAYLADGVMVIGLLPYLAVLVYVAFTSCDTGDAALAAVFTIIFGMGFAYLSALAVAFPAFLWSRSLAKSSRTDTRFSVFLRRSVVCGIFPLFAIFPFLAFSIHR